MKFPSLVAVCRAFAPSSMTFGHDQLSRHPSEIHCDDIVLKAGKALMGRVLGRGKAALAAVVRLVPARGQVPAPVWADGGGRFFRTVEPGASYELRITHPVLGFAQQYLKCKRDLEPIDLGDIHLQPVSVLRGFLVHSDGSTAGNVELCLISTERSFGNPLERGAVVAGGRTDEAGYFEFYGLAEGAYRMQFDDVVGVRSPVKPIVKAQSATQRIVLPYCSVHLLLRREDGRTVHVSRLRVDVSGNPSKREAGVKKPVRRRLTATRDMLLPPGRWRIEASLDGLVGVEELDLPAGVHELAVNVPLRRKRN